jgi:SAM-dependent methyltransferase
MSNQSHPTPERIAQLVWGFAPTLILEAAVRHRVFDLLDQRPHTSAEVATESGASLRGIRSIMNALVGFGLLTRDDRGIFSNTPETSAFLVSGRPGSLSGLVRHASEQLIPRWLSLNQVVATGKPIASVNQEGPGADFFEKFVNDIFPMSYPAANVLAKSWLPTQSGPVKVLDLAAGSGVWGIAMAENSDEVTVTAVDWPTVLNTTRGTVAKFGFTDRFHFVGGDLLEADFGTGNTIATLGHILHSEGIERSKRLLQRVYEALAPGGTIAIAEFLVDSDRRGPAGGLMFSVNMLVNTDTGDTYSFEEVKSWLEEVGFVDARQLEAPGPSPLILATK